MRDQSRDHNRIVAFSWCLGNGKTVINDVLQFYKIYFRQISYLLYMINVFTCIIKLHSQRVIFSFKLHRLLFVNLIENTIILVVSWFKKLSRLQGSPKFGIKV